MTGNPSGITNPISMTTTASTARSDMLQSCSPIKKSGNVSRSIFLSTLSGAALISKPPTLTTLKMEYHNTIQNFDF